MRADILLSPLGYGALADCLHRNSRHVAAVPGGGMRLVWSALSVWFLVLAVLMFDGEWPFALLLLFESIQLGRKVRTEDENGWGLVELRLRK